MTFTSPVRDPGFADSPLHGLKAQAELLNKAMLWCRDFRIACDIGAHIGTCTDRLVRKFKRVWAFEPCPENFECLKKNIGDRAILENIALGDKEGEVSLILPEGANSGMWHAAFPVNDGALTVVETLDMFMLTDVDLIKIDTEGFEGRVVLGAQETIAASKPVVIFEDNGLGPKYFGANWIDPKPILKEVGYAQKARVNKDEIWTFR